MLFAEAHARWLLVVHAVAAGALVAASTHLVVWMRGFIRGEFRRMRAVRRFAVISVGLHLTTLLLGNLIYPVYKVRVRSEYLERPDAVVREYRARAEARLRTEADHRAVSAGAGAPTVALPPDDELLRRAGELPRETAKVARWFDVKEHWAALGCMLALGCMVALLGWDPKRHGAAVAPLVFLMAVGAALTVWLSAVVGVVVTSYRAIGTLG